MKKLYYLHGIRLLHVTRCKYVADILTNLLRYELEHILKKILLWVIKYTP